MGKSLTIYNKQFNKGEETHYLFALMNNYLAAIDSYKLLKVDSDKFTYETGRVKISSSAFSTNNVVPKRGVYICVEDTDNAYKNRFYFVDSMTERSGYVIYELSLDLWATFMSHASFSQYHITRCNRSIGTGLYDEPKMLTNARSIHTLSPSTRSLDNFQVVIALSVVLINDFISGASLTQTILVAIPANTFVGVVDSTHLTMEAIFKIKMLLGGIHAVTSFPFDNNAEVLRAWLVPSGLISAVASPFGNIKTKSIITNSQDATYNSIGLVNAGENYLTIDINNYLNLEGASNLYPQRKFYVGTQNHFIELTRRLSFVLSNAKPKLRCIASTSSISIQIEDGNNVKDITEAFAIDVSKDNKLGTSAQNIAHVLGKIAGYGGSALAMMSNPAIGAVSMAKQVSSSFESAVATPCSDNGDAGSIFCCNQSALLYYPIVLISYDSLEDENENTYFNGASFDEWNKSFASIQSSTHLGRTTHTRDDTFIVCDKMRIDNLPTDAQEHIKSEFERGIWFKSV